MAEEIAPPFASGLRRRFPWWLLPGPLSFGLLAWTGFLWVGVRAHRRRWLVWAGVYLSGMIAQLALLGASTSDSDWEVNTALILTLVLWTGSLVHGLVIKSDVATRLEVLTDSRVVEARRQELRRSVEADIVTHEPRLAREAGLGTSATDGGLVDLNHAPLSLIATLPGVDAATA